MEQLADKEWHWIEEVIQTAMKEVPPGRGYRTGAGLRKHPSEEGDETAIRAGRRQEISRVLTGLKARNKVEIEYVETGGRPKWTRIKLGPSA